MEDQSNPLQYSLADYLCQQLSEIEFLKSMYPLENEIVTDKEVLQSIEEFLNSKSEYIPRYLDITVNIVRNEFKLEIKINLPTLYPTELPDINVRCDRLNRQQETKLNTLLTNHLKENCVGETCIYPAITWLQDYIDDNKGDLGNIKESTICSEEKVSLKHIRMWIISHHIYNKKKREEIAKKAKDGGLTGFCLPGKPGVICYEGPENVCNECWKEIRTMPWKKIGVKKVEELASSQYKKFHKFEEFFADMSDFSKFMEHNGFSDIFNELFGL